MRTKTTRQTPRSGAGDFRQDYGGLDRFVLSLGDQLRAEREARGKSLLDVQRDLRIKAANIAAIENCDPSVFPNKGFVAGYVRSYARYLGLPPDRIYKRFCEESGFEGVNAALKGRSARKKGHATVAGAGLMAGADLTPRFGGLVTRKRESFFNTVSPSGIASVLVLALLIAGIGYGGWVVLQDIQRVEFAPVDQDPALSDEMPQIAAPGAGVTPPVAGESDGAIPTRRSILEQLYRPQDLELPKVALRDGPISEIDPDRSGLFLPEDAPQVDKRTEAELALAPTPDEEFHGPVVTMDLAPPPVDLVATRAAWVRVYQADGTVFLERVLKKGQIYRIPREAVSPKLRAGNSDALYLVVDGKTYGPVGDGTTIVRNIPLDFTAVTKGFPPVADLNMPGLPNIQTADRKARDPS